MKKLIALVTLVIFLLTLTGCGKTLKYKGEERTYEQVEETIEDELESENTYKDLEVNITSDSINSKKKKKK
jgi:uncharacterized lipoprotein